MCYKPKYSIFSLIVIAAILLAGCKSTPVSAPFSPSASLVITGDVEKEICLADYGDWPIVQRDYGDEKQKCIALLPLLSAAGITGEKVSVFFSSPDGAVAEIPLEQINENSLLRLSAEGGWQFIAPDHPPQVGIKFMDYIVIKASEPSFRASCVRIIDGENEQVLTYGELFMADRIERLVLDGQAKKGELLTNVYRRRSLIPLQNYIETTSREDIQTGLAFYASGDQGEISLEGFLEWRGNSVDYLGPDGKTRKKDLMGIWVDPPKLSIKQVVSKSLSAIEKGRVLVILLDGLSYYDVQRAKPEFLSSNNPKKAHTVMPSITPVSLAAALTGKLPNQTGITDRGMRELLSDDIFVELDKMGKTSAMVSGEMKVINTSKEQILNPDLNGDGSTDDEVFACAKKQLEKEIDFIFVHFHGYDDVAHTHGPLSSEALEKLTLLDGYVEELVSNFKGTIFIIADHGQHETFGEKLGDHGEFRLLDMTIPWIEIEGGV